jgi:Sulfotransferase family
VEASHSPGDPPAPPAPFIVGVPRSGTTLLRLMLDAHPELTIPPETHFLPRVIRACRHGASPERVAHVAARHRRWEDFGIEREQYLDRLRQIEPLEAGPAIRAFYELYAEHAGKPRWGDKTPGYAVKMRRIQRALPEAHFIHLIRDGRDVVLSQARKSERPLPVEVAAKRWKRRVVATRKRSEGVDHYTELRYEDLVTDPEAALRRVCELIELSFDPAMLAYHEHATERLDEIDRELPARRGHRRLEAGPRIAAHGRASQPPTPERAGAWRTEMPAADQAAFQEAAGDLLAELGYEQALGSG